MACVLLAVVSAYAEVVFSPSLFSCRFVNRLLSPLYSSHLVVVTADTPTARERLKEGPISVSRTEGELYLSLVIYRLLFFSSLILIVSLVKNQRD